jgi:RHS repeat-associated protein
MPFTFASKILGIVASAVLLSSTAHAAPWTWTVQGSPTEYETKELAVAAMRAQSPQNAVLTIENIDSQTPTQVTYKYTAPPADPLLGPWQYRDGSDSTWHSSEEEAVESGRQILHHPPCPLPIITPAGPWIDYAWVAGFPTSRKRSYSYINYIPNSTCPATAPVLSNSFSFRTSACPTQPAQYVYNQTLDRCVYNAVKFVIGRPNCTCPNPSFGNPCDPATGNKYESATDLIAPGIRFTRHYNSATLDAWPGLGIGWTHAYKAHLQVNPSGGAVSGMVRPDGKQEPLKLISGSTYESVAASGLVVKKVGSEWVVYHNSGTIEVYGIDGKLLRIDDRGQITTLTYTSTVLTSITGPGGHVVQLQYNGGLLSGLVGPAGDHVDYSYDSAGNLSQVVYPDGSSRQYLYEKTNFPNHLTGIVDESGVRYATFDYDSLARAILTEHAGGAGRYTFTYGAGTTSVLDPSGGTQVLTYTNDAYTPRMTAHSIGGASLLVAVPTYASDFQRRPTTKTDRRGIVTKYTYDTFHSTATTEGFGTPLARTKSIQYLNNDTDLPTLITEPNRATAYTYDALGNALTRTITDTSVMPNISRTWTYTYNSLGKVLTEDGPRTDVSDVTTYTYYTCTTGYQCGQLNTVSNALGHVTTYNSYNAYGQPTQITDANGLVTNLAYDLRQRLTDRCTGSTLPGCSGGELTHLDYWPTGLLKKVTNPDASYVEYAYDAAHRLTQINDGALNRIVYSLDAAGNRTAENTYDPGNALRRTHTRIFNTLNQLWKDVNAAGTANVTTTFGYDNNGNQTSVNAPLSRNSSSLYDELNRLKQITDPASGITQFGYDANDNLTSVTDPRNLVTSYTYTGFGDLKTQTSPDTGLTTNTYDSGGNLDTSTDSRGAVTDYAYDAANRVTSASFTLGGVTDQTITYTYDTGANQNGRLTSASDANHTLAWTYDTQGRVTGKGQTVGGTTLAMGYGYNSVGQLGTMQLPSGANVVFGYNANGQVTSLTLNGSTLLSGITYDPFGPITSWTWGNGTTANRAFDIDGKITQVDNAAGLSLKNYGYDDAFRITGITDAVDSSLSWTYGYDSLDRLNAASKTGITQGWTYDANGNRLTQTGTTPSTYTNSGASNRVNSILGSLPRVYAYDNAGNTLSYAGAAFTYNNRGRMATAANGGVTASYAYNALGQRVKRTASGVTTLYAYDEAGHLLGEYTAAGALIQETVWLGDLPVATLRPNGSGGVLVYYVHADHLNTSRLVTDTSNNVRWRWESDPFGTTAPDENPTSLGTFVYDLRFPGQQYDAVVGLHYNYFRDYDPAVGKYVQSDPIGLKGGVNTYAYVRGRPTILIDPKGLCSCQGGSWKIDAGDLTASVAVGGYFSFGRAVFTCKSSQGVSCSGYVWCIGGGPILGAGLSFTLKGDVQGVSDSNGLEGWSGWQVTSSVGPVSSQGGSDGGSVGAGPSLGAGVATIKCHTNQLRCQCCEK